MSCLILILDKCVKLLLHKCVYHGTVFIFLLQQLISWIYCYIQRMTPKLIIQEITGCAIMKMHINKINYYIIDANKNIRCDYLHLWKSVTSTITTMRKDKLYLVFPHLTHFFWRLFHGDKANYVNLL